MWNVQIEILIYASKTVAFIVPPVTKLITTQLTFSIYVGYQLLSISGETGRRQDKHNQPLCRFLRLNKF